jgi:5-methylcytosine-specific restriction endonuclease McrA
MSKQRTPPAEETKVKLLRETNYRCGYCLKNITPVAYFTENRNSKEAQTKIPKYYQPYDVAHIVPYNETQDQSFENLIALCKECHWKSESGHNNAMIPREK